MLVVARVEVDPPSAAVVTGQSLQLTAVPKTEGGIVLPAQDVVWASTSEATATVSAGGLVQAVSAGGPVRIRATISGVTGETQITVLPVPVDRVVVTPPSPSIPVGQSILLSATAFDAAGNPLTGRVISWATAAPDIAAVTTTGMVIGIAAGGPVSITATSEGKSGSSLVTVSPRPPSRLGFLQQPGPTIAGGPITPAVTVAVQDNLGATVTGATNAVTIALGNNPGGSTLTGTRTVAAINGVATFPNLSLNRSGNGYTLVASAQALTPATSASFNVTAGTGTRLTFTVAPPATARSGVPFAANPVVQVRDASGNAVAAPGISITATVAPTGATLGGTTTAVTSASGAATFSGLKLSGVLGSYTITFAGAGVTPIASAPIVLSAGDPASLSITTQPAASAQSGIPLTRQPVVRLLDGAGNLVLQSGVLVTAAIASGPSGGTLGGTLTTSTDGSGIASFTNLALSGPSGSYTLRFSSAGVPTVSSGGIALGAGSGSTLTLTTPPSGSVANGQVFPQQPVIQLRDAAGNPVGQAGVLVAASIQTGGGLLGGATTVATNASGVAAFTDLSITGQTGGRTLLFASAGYVSVVSGAITVAHGAAARIAVTGQPSGSAQSGVAFPQQPVVQIQDASGNPVSQAGTTITASLASGPAGGSLGGTTVATTGVTGAAAFSNLSLIGPPGTYTLAFAATALSGATSNPVTLGAGAATGLVLATQPSSAAVNATAFPQQPVVQLVDGSGNPAGQAGVPVSVALSGGGGTLGGVSTVNTDAAGRAAFAGLAITGKTGNYALAFSAPGLAGVTSAAIGLAPGPVAQLVLTTQPSATATNGAPFAQQPVVQVQDVSGNAVSGAVVTVSIATGGGSLGGSGTATSDANGVATFSGLAITGLVGTRTLGFDTPGVSRVVSGPIAVSAGPATQLAVTTQPSSTAQSGVPFPQQPVARVADVSGNPVSGVLVTVTIASGGGTLGGTTTATSDASGLAAFTNLSISGAVGVYSLGFTAPGTTPATSSAINLAAGPATHIVIVQQPSGSANNGKPFARQPIIQLLDAAGNGVPAASVTAAISSAFGSGKLNGTLTITTDAAGLATFTDLEISKGGFYTLRFSSGGLSVVSSLITVN